MLVVVRCRVCGCSLVGGWLVDGRSVLHLGLAVGLNRAWCRSGVLGRPFGRLVPWVAWGPDRMWMELRGQHLRAGEVPSWAAALGQGPTKGCEGKALGVRGFKRLVVA